MHNNIHFLLKLSSEQKTKKGVRSIFEQQYYQNQSIYPRYRYVAGTSLYTLAKNKQQNGLIATAGENGQISLIEFKNQDFYLSEIEIQELNQKYYASNFPNDHSEIEWLRMPPKYRTIGNKQKFDLIKEKAKILQAHSNSIFDLSFDSHGTNIFSASADRTLKQFDVERCQEIRSFGGFHTSSVKFCRQIQNEPLILSGGGDGSIGLWDTRQNNISNQLKSKIYFQNKQTNFKTILNQPNIMGMEIIGPPYESLTTQYLAVAYSQLNLLPIYDLRMFSNESLITELKLSSPIYHMNHEYPWLLTMHTNKNLKLWQTTKLDIESPIEINQEDLKISNESTSAVSLQQNYPRIFTNDQQGTIWTQKYGQKGCKIGETRKIGHMDQLDKIIILNNYLATCSRDCSILFWPLY